MSTKLEHANLCVSDIDGIIKFLQTALPDFFIRHDETDNDGDRWVHIGNDKTYISLNNSTQKTHLTGHPIPENQVSTILAILLTVLNKSVVVFELPAILNQQSKITILFVKDFIFMIPKAGIGNLLSITQMMWINAMIIIYLTGKLF